jgi:hypothetical protein
MSNAEEFQVVDVPELEEEEALSEDDDAADQDDEPVQGVVALLPLVPLNRRGALKIRVRDEFRLRNNFVFFLPYFYISKIWSPERFAVGTSLFMSECYWLGFGSHFQTLLGSWCYTSGFPRVRSC